MSSSNNPAVTAKARAMYGKRISNSQYEDLINCKNVGDIASYLKSSTNYSDALLNINESTIHRGELELTLMRYVFDFYSKIYHYINPAGENLFHYIVEEFVLKEILRMILLLKAGNPEEYILELPGFLIKHSSFDLIELAKVRSFEDLLRFLSGSDYENGLKQFIPDDDMEFIDYARVEHTLYENFFRKMFHMINSSTKGSEKQELMRLFGIRIDLLNLSNAYRAKVIFNTDEDNIKKRILPFFHKFNSEMLDELISSSSKQQVDDLVKKWLTHYDNLLGDTELHPSNSLSARIENPTQRINFELCKNYLHLSQNISTVFYSFYIISQIELDNIIYIIEGVRYNLPAEEIKRLIIK